MSYYEVLLFLHVAAAAVWLGSGFFLQMLVVRASRADDAGLMQGLASNSGWLAQRIFIPASLVVLVVGILLTIEGPWIFGDLWIVLGLAGYAFSFLVGILFLEPEGKRLVVLYLVVAVMALKPTGDDVGALVLLAAVLLAAVAYWAPKLRPATA